MELFQKHSGQGDNILGSKNVENIGDDKIVTNHFHISLKGWIVITVCLTAFLIAILAGSSNDSYPESDVILSAENAFIDSEVETGSYEYYLEKGAHLVNNEKNYTMAIQYFSKAIGMDPNRPEAYYGRGTAYNLTGQTQKSIQDLSEAAELGGADAYGNLAWAYFDQGDYYSSYQYFLLDLETPKLSNSDIAHSYCGAAICLYLLNYVDEAKTMYLNAIGLDPRYDGNFGALDSDYLINARQMKAIKSLHAEFF